MADGVLDAGSLRIWLNLTQRKDAEDGTEAPKPSAPVAEPAAAPPAEPQCGMPMPPSTVQPREAAGKFESKVKRDGHCLDPSRRLQGKFDSIDLVGPEALEYNNVAQFEKSKKEVFRVPSKDMDCTATANANTEYLRQSEVETWLTNMGVETGNKFKTQMSKLKTLKLFYEFVRNDPRMASWPVAAHKDGDKKLLLCKNPLAIFLLKNNGVTKIQYQQFTGIEVPADTPYAVSHLEQANLIIKKTGSPVVCIRMMRARRVSKPEDPGGGRLYAATTIRLKVYHLMAALNELEERLKALNFLPDTYIRHLPEGHVRQSGPVPQDCPCSGRLHHLVHQVRPRCWGEPTRARY
jgi:hypothetical protein